MNLALSWLWKEWHAQWRLLASYLGLALASIAIVCWLLPSERWLEAASGVNALGWFVAIGVVGVVLFAAPMTVNAEFAPKDDQFLRRLPGALAPAAAGKLAFLVLLGLGLPLLSLLLGEVVLWALGVSWHGIFAVTVFSSDVVPAWPFVGVASLAALLLAPWVASVGTWLPGGRMAVGGTVLLLLIVSLAAFFVLRLCPGLEETIEWRPWLWFVWPAGMLLFVVSLLGRRGGGHGRSAMRGLPAFAAIVAIPGSWFGSEVWRYHHPDPECMHIGAYGLSPDGQKVLLHGRGHEQWRAGATFCLDLASGEATQITPVWSGLHAATLGPLTPSYDRNVRRWWRTFSNGEQDRVFDLELGEWHDVPSDRMALELEGELREAIANETRATTPFRLPGDRRAWRDGTKLCIEQPDGSVREVPWPDRLGGLVHTAGHGLRGTGSQPEFYDLQLARIVAVPKGTADAVQVRDRWLVALQRGAWHRRDSGDGSMSPIAELAGCACQGLVDDDRVLFARPKGRDKVQEWFVYRPADGRIEPVLGDGGDVRRAWTRAGLPRDAAGRTWLVRGQGNGTDLFYLALDPATLRVESLPVAAGRAFALLGNDVFTVEDSRRVVRTDYTTGVRTVLYPPMERSER